MTNPLAPIIQPDAIEAESFRIIDAEMGAHDFSVLEWPIVQRAIHATADFELGRSMLFHPRAVEAGLAALRRGAPVVADVQMIQAGISATYLAELGGRLCCYMADADVAEQARAEGTTRAIQCMRKAAREAPAPSTRSATRRPRSLSWCGSWRTARPTPSSSSACQSGSSRRRSPRNGFASRAWCPTSRTADGRAERRWPSRSRTPSCDWPVARAGSGRMKLYAVGVGPGAPDLLTLRAGEILRRSP